MAEEGKISLSSFRILNPQSPGRFPFLRSTRLYPEWPFAKVKHTPDDLARKVVVALLNMPPNGPAARAAMIEGWTIPLDYQPVHDLMKELRVGPYKDYGKITLGKAVQMYWYWVALAALVILLMAVAILRAVRLNGTLWRSKRELVEARSGLEKQVQERTAGLENKNNDLQHEVSRRKHAEEQSLRAKEEWELTFNAIPDLIALIDAKHRIMRVNNALAQKLEMSPEKLIGEPCFVHICGAEEPPPRCPHTRTMADGREHSVEMQLEHFGGDYFVTTSPLNDPDGRITGVVHVSRDITERKKTEDALRQSETRSRSLVEQSLVGIYIITDGKFVYVNPKLAEIFGYESPKEIVFSKRVADLVAPESRDLVAGNIRKRLRGEVKSIHYTLKGLRKNNDVIDVEAYGTQTEIDGKPAVIGTLLDITEQKRTEDERLAAQRFLQSVIDGVDESIMVIAPDRRVILMNRPAQEFSIQNTFCYHISHHRDEPCDPGDQDCPIEKVIASGKPVTVTHTHIRKDGSGCPVEILASPIFDKQGKVIYVIEATRDISAKIALEKMQQEMQERLFQQQKEQSITTLAGGIAHDFNNILMGVVGNAELLRMRYPSGGKEQEHISTIVGLSKRMAHLTRQLLAYAKQGAYEQKAISLDNAVQEALALAHKGRSSAIEVVLELAPDLWPVLADPGQMKQVLISLLSNAFEAMEDAGGRLIVRGENLGNKEAWECALGHHHPRGEYVRVSVSDTGPGIPPEIQKRIFEPFFTTKFMGRGLGLAAAVGICQNHNGCISLTSEPGGGAAFHIFLPRFRAALEKKGAGPDTRIKGKILVVENEPQVLSLIRMMLAELGFDALLAENGTDALKLFSEEKNAVRLALLDLQMPGMNGKQLCRELKSLKPGLKVLISSGYDQTTALDAMDACQPDGFIQKPYWIDALREKIRTILSS
jgi:PAS domain S-box-containing protein